jgi:glycosyltransferase involved in cell wall biosynthesis
VTKLSVTVITKNEAAHIEACLASVAWADERLVVDSGSTDGTPELARRAGARVIEREWPGYATQKNVAAAAAAHDWILSVDADERVTPALAEEIQQLLRTEPPRAGYRVPRVTWHLGRWIRTTDWYPDYQLRLYDRRRAAWPVRRVHESVAIGEAAGAPGLLTGDLQHYAYLDISHHHRTMDLYTTLAAEDMRADGRRASLLDIVVHPPAAFLRNYLLRRGIADGVPGFIVSAMNAHYVFLKFAKLWALERAAADPATRRDSR